MIIFGNFATKDNNDNKDFGFTLFGKDEVGSSNLPSSSKRKPLKSSDFGGFLYFSALFEQFLIVSKDLVTKKLGV